MRQRHHSDVEMTCTFETDLMLLCYSVNTCKIIKYQSLRKINGRACKIASSSWTHLVP